MVKIYEVGGCVRDHLLGLKSKDIDFVVIASSYQEMREYMMANKFKVYLENPEYVTIRAGVPDDSPLRARAKDADFVLARRDSPGGDGRHPDWVEPGTLEDDLARRDFSINAMARNPEDGTIIDLHGGQEDLKNKVLRFVGDPMQRIREDGLRTIRGLRFIVTKGLHADRAAFAAITSPEAAQCLHYVSIERIREEIEKMVACNTLASIGVLAEMPACTQNAIFRNGLRLSARYEPPVVIK